MGRMTNEEFGERVDCHYSMASRLRTGARLPSRDLLRRIIAEFGLDRMEAYDAYDQGRDGFSRYIRDKVFEPSEDVSAPSESASTEETTPEGDG